MPAHDHSLLTSGDKGIQQANEKRFEDRVQQLFKQLKDQRLTAAALQCEKLINNAIAKLTEVSYCLSLRITPH